MDASRSGDFAASPSGEARHTHDSARDTPRPGRHAARRLASGVSGAPSPALRGGGELSVAADRREERGFPVDPDYALFNEAFLGGLIALAARNFNDRSGKA